MLRLLAGALVVLCCGTSGHAIAAGAEPCRNGSFPEQAVAFGMAKVIGPPRVWLRSDIPPCPDDSAACRGHSYVVPGDIVLTGTLSGPYVCVLFPNRQGGSAGYVRQAEIAPKSLPATIPFGAWVGTWRDGDNSISLHVDDSSLTASGQAYWPSAHPSPKLRPGGPNEGQMEGRATPTGNSAVFGGNDAGECRVTLTLLPPFMLAADNHNCGGMNVSFTGVYQKR